MKICLKNLCKTYQYYEANSSFLWISKLHKCLSNNEHKYLVNIKPRSHHFLTDRRISKSDKNDGEHIDNEIVSTHKQWQSNRNTLQNRRMNLDTISLVWTRLSRSGSQYKFAFQKLAKYLKEFLFKCGESREIKHYLEQYTKLRSNHYKYIVNQ